MGKAIAIHSYKGGTGKTIIAANLAHLFAKEGKNVFLIDYDCRSPSQHILFKEQSKKFFNDFLEGKMNLLDVSTEMSSKYNTKGKFTVAFSNPSASAIFGAILKDKKWEANAYQRIASAKDELLNKHGYDYFILDTSPGIYFASVNAIVASDLMLLIMKPTEFDFTGTKELIHGIQDKLSKQRLLILNNYVVQEDSDEESIRKDLESNFDFKLGHMIPHFCDLLIHGTKGLLAINKPEHEFLKHIDALSKKI
ncbi:MAG: ParA family protein [Candidatus Bathyarchaeota archaeon]|nr:ParA family protein [Candidatus Bathyarchaeota archaeon]